MILSKDINKICAVIPFYNEEQHLLNVINKTFNYVNKIILVDDGSTDNSVNIIPVNSKIVLLKHEINLGKGAALKTGLLKSIELNSEITITLDADLQHAPERIPAFIDSIKNKDCVVGSRLKDLSTMPIHRRLSNILTSKILSIKSGKKILDSQSGFRAFRTEILPEILPENLGFEAESEMLIKICKKNKSLGFIDVPTIYGNDDSKIKAIPTIMGFIKVIIKY